MKISDQLSLALRMFRTRPMRTSLTVLGVGVGIGTVLFLVSLGYGLQRTILSRIASADTLLTLDVSAGSEAYALTDKSIDTITKIPGVAEVSRMANLSAQATFGSLTSDNHVLLVDPSFFRLAGMKAASGSLFTKDSDRFAVLSTATVMLFGKSSQDIIGKTVDLSVTLPQTQADNVDKSLQKPSPTTFSGSYAVEGVVTDDSASYIYLPRSMADIPPISRYDLVKVKVTDSGKLEGVRQAILDQGYVVSAVSDVIDQASKVFQVLQIILGLFGLVALGVSAIGMFNTMTITLLERTNEIGIMRAIGITRGDIRTLFLVESMVMGFLGGLAGLAMGEVGGFLVNLGLNMLAQRFHGPSVDIFYTPLWFVAVVLAFSSVIGFLTGLYPSFRASRLNPLDALRYK